LALSVDALLTVAEVARMMRVAEVTVRRWIASGRLRATKVTDRSGWRIRESEVARLSQPREPDP
jgi:putative resolvase